jgi:DNA-binding helix-hairpin-helix protein with protein kinase domain
LLYNNAYSPGVPFASDLVAARRFEYTSTEDLSREVARILIECGVRDPEYVVKGVIQQICRSDWTPPTKDIEEWKRDLAEDKTRKRIVRKLKELCYLNNWVKEGLQNLIDNFLRFLGREPENEGVHTSSKC